MLKSAERTLAYFGLHTNDRVLLSLPCRFIAGKMMVVRAILGQMSLISIDPSTNFDFLLHQSFEFGALVPNQVVKILGQSDGAERLQNIHNLLIGGSGISSELESLISPLSNRVVITYGMTETASHIAIRELSGNRKKSYYQCLPGISVTQNQSGCLQINHPDYQELVQTNDLAEILSQTTFRIQGRADSIIISGGIKYSPEVLEKKLEGILKQRFVISSQPDDLLGEKLILVIECEPFSQQKLWQDLKQCLPTFEVPGHIFFLKTFPETATRKINRQEIRKIIHDISISTINPDPQISESNK
jgi:O-succinylbenzoic acid--CoA ligase